MVSTLDRSRFVLLLGTRLCAPAMIVNEAPSNRKCSSLYPLHIHTHTHTHTYIRVWYIIVQVYRYKPGISILFHFTLLYRYLFHLYTRYYRLTTNIYKIQVSVRIVFRTYRRERSVYIVEKTTIVGYIEEILNKTTTLGKVTL